MRVTSLVENTSLNNDFNTEHGLSLYIETDGNKILFDMGQGELFAENADRLGINLAEVDIAVVSHGHYDHGGGLRKFLEINQNAPVYLSKYAFEPYYNGTEKYIGLDISLANSERLVLTEDIAAIGKGLTLYSCNTESRNYNLGNFGLTMLQNGEFLPDDFRHEQYLLIEENGKKVLISGCSHKGIMDIARWFTPDIIIGGFHFSKMKLDETLMGYAKALNVRDTDFYTCHCTGSAQFEFMKTYMGRLFYLHCGQSIDI